MAFLSLGVFDNLFILLGVLFTSYTGLKLSYHAFIIWRTYFFTSSNNFKKYGQWAVVTGATDGIGKEYALQLACKGLNIVLISRTQSKLDTVAKEIMETTGRKTVTICADFSHGTSIYDNIKEKLSGLDIGILVNNVGLSYSYPEFFIDLPNRDKFIMDLLNVNVVSCTMMSTLVLPGMLTHTNKQKGLIINIASLSGVYPCPLLSVYSACKAYVVSFTTCLRSEYEDRGIDIQCICPGFVSTNMSKISRASWQVPSPKTFVKSALATIPFSSDNFGVFAHHLLGTAFYNLPEWFNLKTMKGQMLGARTKSLRRRAKNN